MPKVLCEVCSSTTAVTTVDLNTHMGEEPLLYSVCEECDKLEKLEAMRILNEDN